MIAHMFLLILMLVSSLYKVINVDMEDVRTFDYLVNKLEKENDRQKAYSILKELFALEIVQAAFFCVLLALIILILLSIGVTTTLKGSRL